MTVSTNIIQRTFQILHNGKNATAYAIEKDDKQYLVSASHIFDGSPAIDTLSVYHDKRWKQIRVDVVFNSDSNAADTIAFRLPKDIAPRHPITYGTAGVITGSWAYFLGFPRGMRVEAGMINNQYPLPLIKAALVSGIDFERHGFCTLYLDGHLNKGFSGGPVVWHHPAKQKNFQLIGTIAGYEVEHPLSKETKEEVIQYETNAGIIRAHWVKDLFKHI